MSRAEFITMAYRTLGLDGLNLEKETSYQDLDSLDWAKDTLKKADQAGILSLAFPGTTLNPTAPMSREEAVVLLDHVINLKGALTKSEDAKETVDLIRDFMAEKARQEKVPQVFPLRTRPRITLPRPRNCQLCRLL